MELEEPVFNSAKKRKFIRKRPVSPSVHSQSDVQESGSVKDAPNPGTDDTAPITEILRARRGLKPRRAGIEFSTESKWSSEPPQSTEPVVVEESGNGRFGGILDRFVGLSEQKVDVDKHMMAYIDCEIAKRKRRATSTEPASPETVSEDAHLPGSQSRLPQRQPATLGKLQEIDLGLDSKLRNIERTEVARRILAGGESVQNETANTDGRNVRLDKSGKPWRHRKRRNSEDIRRDQLVEEVLRESKLDVYEEPDQEGGDDGQAADDRIAEQFRRDFLDAIQSRRRGVRSKTTKSTKGEVPKGPKLGGSRSARAAMREKQEKSAKK